MAITALTEELCLFDFARSTKGASKQRRDQINSEINTLRDLLPLPESSRLRLSQLQIMSLSCVFIRKCTLLQKVFGPQRVGVTSPFDFFQSLSGFLLVTTREGKLVYISENVTEYLGHSMIDMKTQGDSLYDIIDKRDHSSVQAQLLQSATPESVVSQREDITFFCRMNMSRCLKRQTGPGDIKVMHIKGHFVPALDADTVAENSLFMAICSPLLTPDVKDNVVQSNTLTFKSVHCLDMRFIEITQSGELHVGLTNDEIFGKSWYSMLYPEDIHEAKEKHTQLVQSRHEMGCMMTVRMLAEHGGILHVNIVMHIKQAVVPNSNDAVIVCINQVISEKEFNQFKLQSQLYAYDSSSSPDYFCPTYSGSNPPSMDNDTFLPGRHNTEQAYYMPDVNGFRASPPNGYNGFPTGINRGFSYPSGEFAVKHERSIDHEQCTRKMEHAHTMHALKLKLRENAMAPCKSAKKARMSPTARSFTNGHQVVNSYTDGAVQKSTMGFNGSHFGMPRQNNQGFFQHGPIEILTAPVVYPDININTKAIDPLGLNAALSPPMSIDGSLMSPPLMSPPMPIPHGTHISLLSPPLSASPSSGITQMMAEDPIIPDWYLTPDASPLSSPSSVTEAEVQALAKTIEAKLEEELGCSAQLEAQSPIGIKQEKDLLLSGCQFAENINGATTPAQPACPTYRKRRARKRSVKKEILPIMDADEIESFFYVNATSPISDVDEGDMNNNSSVTEDQNYGIMAPNCGFSVQQPMSHHTPSPINGIVYMDTEEVIRSVDSLASELEQQGSPYHLCSSPIPTMNASMMSPPIAITLGVNPQAAHPASSMSLSSSADDPYMEQDDTSSFKATEEELLQLQEFLTWPPQTEGRSMTDQ